MCGAWPANGLGRCHVTKWRYIDTGMAGCESTRHESIIHSKQVTNLEPVPEIETTYDKQH